MLQSHSHIAPHCGYNVVNDYIWRESLLDPPISEVDAAHMDLVGYDNSQASAWAIL